MYNNTMDSSKSKSDEQLLLLAAHGDKQAYGLLYERYLEDIYRYVLLKVGVVETAEDLTEETFIRTWEYLPGLTRKDGKITHLKAFLYRTAGNLVIDFYRKKKPENLNPDHEIEFRASPEKMAEMQDEKGKLVKLVRKLRPDYQKVIILRFVNQLSHQETAAILKISESHSRVLQYRALKRLQTLMKEEA